MTSQVRSATFGYVGTPTTAGPLTPVEPGPPGVSGFILPHTPGPGAVTI